MSTHRDRNGIVIHESVELSPEEIKAFLDVAEDLRDGVIRSFDMEYVSFCGSPCCIAGYIAYRLGCHDDNQMCGWYASKRREHPHLQRLFHSSNPNCTERASQAIIHYLETGIGQWPKKQV